MVYISRLFPGGLPMINITTLTNIKPMVKILVTSAALIFGVIILSIVITVLTHKNTPQISTTPPKITPQKITQVPTFINELSKLKSVLPYKAQNYSIEYLEPVNIINVKISASSEDEFIKVKKEAESYITSRGIKDICSLNIFWVPPSNLAPKTIKATNLITTGCPPIPKR